MKYIEYKEFLPSLRNLRSKGGQHQKAASRINDLRSLIGDNAPDPFKGFRPTKHGEKRIKNCRKYDLTGYSRLVTVVKDGFCFLLYAGTHNDCEKWIEKNRGLDPAADKKGNLIKLYQSDGLGTPIRIRGESDLSYGKLFEILTEEDFDLLVEGLRRSIVRRIERLESINEDEDIVEIVKDIEDEDRQKVVYDVFALLRQGDHKAANNRIASFRGDIVPPSQGIEVIDSEDFRNITKDDAEQFEHYIRTADYRDWMMFMHLEQERIATAEFAGPAKLIGVSGSGKTCIVVKRAATLAERYPNGEILVLTLNRPLAGLIRDLVLSYCPFPDVRDRIKVAPFFELCQEFLGDFEPENKKLYNDLTWKTLQHIDEVWREYYRLELNNRQAECMIPVHDSLISKGIDAERYIREEFDWIRSAISCDQRERYRRGVNRSGRKYPLSTKFRTMLLEGLEKWEVKMHEVGISDYLGIATALYRHRDKLRPKYRCILIDECQDFGTIELELVVALVEEGPDNLFFCGDAAQHVSWKHQSFKAAGISLPGARSRKIDQNYRNNRNILRAAYQILYSYLTEEMIEKEDFEILDPKFANFGGPRPLRLEARSFREEIAYAIAYTRSELQDYPNRKACVAICGYSLQQIQKFGKRHKLPVLDSMLSIDKEQLFLSDLEQTKGFEFDLVCIVNTGEEIIPNPTTPMHERFRDLSKLYVAMTRAKLQLILSYSNVPSSYIDGNEMNEHFHFDTWANYFCEKEIKGLGIPPSLDKLHEEHLKERLPSLDNMKIEEFLYTPQAHGISLRLINKLREGASIGWSTLSEVLEVATKNPESVRKHFGPTAYKEFQKIVRHLGLRKDWFGP